MVYLKEHQLEDNHHLALHQENKIHMEYPKEHRLAVDLHPTQLDSKTRMEFPKDLQLDQVNLPEGSLSPMDHQEQTVLLIHTEHLQAPQFHNKVVVLLLTMVVLKF